MSGLVRDLCSAVADLGAPARGRERAWVALRLGALLLVLVVSATLYWRLPLGLLAVLALLPAGLAYALLLIATHEMVHGTLLGWPRFERLLGCLLSWPMAWPFLTYCRLHRLHHRWNGRDPRDPERTDVLPQERLQADGLWRPLARCHPLLWRALALGGVGLIADTALKGWQLRQADPRLAAARWRDGLGVGLLHALLLSVALTAGVPARYLLFWIVLERLIGVVVQTRGLVEHHGLWRDHGSHLRSQLYATRNVTADGWLNALMGGLPHHSAHHAFPWIPTARLPAASRRIAAVLQRHGQPPLPRAESYAAAVRSLLGEA